MTLRRARATRFFMISEALQTRRRNGESYKHIDKCMSSALHTAWLMTCFWYRDMWCSQVSKNSRCRNYLCPEFLHAFFGVLPHNVFVVVVPVNWKKNPCVSYPFNLMIKIPVYQLIVSYLCSHLHSPLMVYWFLTDCSFLSLH